MFQPLPSQRSFVFVLLKRLCLVVLSAYLVIGLISAYRAWYQVKSLDLRLEGSGSLFVPNDSRAEIVGGVANGSVFEADLVSYARTHIDVRLELVQGTNSETLALGTLPGNEWGFWDPRTRQRSFKTVLTDEVLNHFQPGRAKLRATATGRHQWMRLPPPVVREITVELPGKNDKS
jgi:hypothetical protein